MFRSSRKAKGTPATNKHVFEPFSKRIARLKIDPIHTVRGRSAIDESSDLSQSYFRTALEEWSSLNLTVTFGSFLRSASPLSETLPQLLHHADLVFELLVQHIEKKDSLALEPLLDLTAQFAHDLGQEFEKYFGRVVSLVADVAATQDGSDVVEWCFTCLAWMFKYLSRLLVQDLRPLLRIFRPYLSARKEYISRFSAESLAFLMRKAAIAYPKRKAPLTLALNELLEVESGSGEGSDYGIKFLLVESCLGVDAELHSGAQSVINCLLETVASTRASYNPRRTVQGVLIGLVHQTDSSSFEPVVSAIINFTSDALAARNDERLDLAVEWLRTILGAWKATRISQWKEVLSVAVALAENHPEEPPGALLPQVQVLVALLLQYAPMDQLLPFAARLLDISTKQLTPTQFFSFCTVTADLGKERFGDLLLPRLQQYIVSRFSEDEAGLIFALDRLNERGMTGPERLESASIWDQRILDRLSGDAAIPSVLLASFCRLPHVVRFPVNRDFKRVISDAMHLRIVAALDAADPNMDSSRRISVGWLIEAYIALSPTHTDAAVLWEQLMLGPRSCLRLLPFLRGCNRLASLYEVTDSLAEPARMRIVASLTDNLLAPSEAFREQSLLLLQTLGSRSNGPWLRDTLDSLIEILRIPYLPSNARSISMLLRRLPQRQKARPDDKLLATVIPYFCLGMLQNYHDQTRKDLSRALGDMIVNTPLEDTVLDILGSWLRQPVESAAVASAPHVAPQQHSIFQDANSVRIELVLNEVSDLYESPTDRMEAMAKDAHKLETIKAPPKSRSLALHALMEMIEIVERRSRLLSPIFLAAQFTRTTNDGTEHAESSDSSETLSPDITEAGWSLADRKLFVTLFANFQNPRVLFRSAEVYDKLLDLLSNGNADIRKQALLAILRWKNATLLKHETMLMKIIEEKIPSADIGIMLNAESEENIVKPDERSTVLPVLLRLIYGLIVGRSGSYGSQQSRRNTLLRMLFRMDEAEVILFLNISLGKLKDITLGHDDTFSDELLHREITSPDQRYGFVRMMLSLLETLQSQFASFGKHVVEPLLYCILRSSLLTDSPSGNSNSLERNIRKNGIQCLTMIFETSSDIVWQPYIRPLFARVITPRMKAFAAENSQAVSTLLRLLAVWCQSPKFILFLTDYDHQFLPVTWETLGSPLTKPAVKAFILNDMLLQLLHNAQKSGSDPTSNVVLQRQVPMILQSMTSLLSSAPATDVLQASTAVLLELAPLTTSSSHKDAVTALLVDLLASSKHRLSPVVKASLLKAIHALLRSSGGTMECPVFDKLLDSVSSLFNYFKDRPNRITLCDALETMTERDDRLRVASEICRGLNAMSSERLDNVDFDRRLAAFQETSILEIREDTVRAWKPVMHNLLFFCRDEDFSIRSNAVSSMRGFIKRAAPDSSTAVSQMIHGTLLPALQKGLTHDSEVVRADMVSLFGLLVQYLDEPRLSNMKPLLVDNDEEASFFSNILHIQQHRRLRAIRRLVVETEKGAISAANIVQVFVPLLQNFIRDQSPDDSTQGTKGQSLLAMKVLLQWTEWKQFKGIFKQYKTDLQGEEQAQKTAIKMLSHAADALLEARIQQDVIARDPPSNVSHLARSLPPSDVVAEEVREQLLSKLADFVHYRDEREMSARLPAATVAIKLIKLLPFEEGQILSAPVVLDVANVLKSRAQESRDAGRAVLVEIIGLLGSGSVQFVLRQMRSALQRGYQLHVLSYTLHSILVKLSPSLGLSDLDYCTSDLTSVIMDDIFGTVGQEKDNEDYVSEMKEVKSKKSFDSMELISRCTGLDHLKLLIQPITALLTGSLRSKQVQDVDKLLHRIGIGVGHNPAANERGLLVFAYHTIQNFYKEKPAPIPQAKTNNERNRERFLVQGPASRAVGSASSMVYKVARFAIDLVRSALVKHNELLTPENVHGFLPVIGDALIEGQEDVQKSALRLLSAIVKLRMPELDSNCPLYAAEAVKIVKNCTSTDEEVAQAALKLVAAVLRERKNVKVRDSDVVEILKRITPDMDDPSRQGVTFNFIRAVLARKYDLPEVYDIVDKIAATMVTSQGREARDVARGVYVHFLVEYPQKPSRWSKQQKFLVKNLDYDYPEGRQSVMEAMSMLLKKISGDSAQQLVAAFFVPVVLRLANDEHGECRELAGALLGQIFVKADQQRMKEMLGPLEGWLEQDENTSLIKLALQAFGILFRVTEKGNNDQVQLCRTRIGGLLLSAALEDDAVDLQCAALDLLSILTEARPAAVLSTNAESIWASVRALLSHRGLRIRHKAAALVRSFLESCDSKAWSRIPLANAYGLRWDAASLQQPLRACVRILRLNQEDAKLNDEIVPIMVFLGRCSSINGLTIPLNSNADKSLDEIENEGQEEINHATSSIPATQYILDQLSFALRRETTTMTTGAFLPKVAALYVLTTLLPHLNDSSLAPTTLSTLLLPLIHLTSTSAGTPHSADPTFARTYEGLVTAAQDAMNAIQEKVGDEAYIKAMTVASRVAKERREERRRKRVIERVADPEAAARLKRKKGDRKKERKREIGQQFGVRRKARGW
ncbi:uncharacterized protein HMPREF1541_05509 [Cyphellophora europaea CBS 101466]|uniref:Uncharacterized protein n=1 Tax=Cyphellophora europaea (strain CBS 101466) TaxID=1220924 RepID=W2RRY8_CYPE1|nr:uncharacterized protein HMPREF1541_05509 [Cyphellophora europaea CBS 101466]ETN39286.1 hypothetical protein HMPREF1541_05509 [Cyphellophora europaea CBS 101466]